MPRSTIAAAVVGVLVLVAWTGAAAYTQCKDIVAGDKDGCVREVVAKCTQQKYWDKRRCEAEIAERHDICGSEGYKRACAKALKIYRSYCAPGKTSFGEGSYTVRSKGSRPGGGGTRGGGTVGEWLTRARKVESAVASYQRFHERWHACYPAAVQGCTASASNYKDCAGAPDDYREFYHAHVDEVLGRGYVEKGEAAMKAGDRTNAEHFAGETINDLKQLAALNAGVGKKLRYKAAKIDDQIGRAEKLMGHSKRAERTAIAARRCPKGRKLGGQFTRLIKQRFEVKVKRQVIRQTGNKRKSRHGLISKESIPVAVCSEIFGKGEPDYCTATSVTIYREKPPRAPWTSWQVSVGIGHKINCKKLR